MTDIDIVERLKELAGELNADRFWHANHEDASDDLHQSEQEFYQKGYDTAIEAATLISQLRNRLSDLEPLYNIADEVEQWLREYPVSIEGYIQLRAQPRRMLLAWIEAIRKVSPPPPYHPAASPSPPIPAVEIDGEKERG